MQFTINGKPAAVTSQDTALAIHHGWVSRSDGQLLLCATDSFTLIRVPLPESPEGFEDAEGMIPHEALVLHERHPELPFTVAEKHIMVGQDAYFRRVPNLTFPNLDAILPGPPSEPMRVAIDTEILSRIASALGHSQVELTFDLSAADRQDGVVLYNKPILVKRFTDGHGDVNEGDGVIMPVRVKPSAATPPPEPTPEPKTPRVRPTAMPSRRKPTSRAVRRPIRTSISCLNNSP